MLLEELKNCLQLDLYLARASAVFSLVVQQMVRTATYAHIPISTSVLSSEREANRLSSGHARRDTDRRSSLTTPIGYILRGRPTLATKRVRPPRTSFTASADIDDMLQSDWEHAPSSPAISTTTFSLVSPPSSLSICPSETALSDAKLPEDESSSDDSDSDDSRLAKPKRATYTYGSHSTSKSFVASEGIDESRLFHAQSRTGGEVQGYLPVIRQIRRVQVRDEVAGFSIRSAGPGSPCEKSTTHSGSVSTSASVRRGYSPRRRTSLSLCAVRS